MPPIMWRHILFLHKMKKLSLLISIVIVAAITLSTTNKENDMEQIGSSIYDISIKSLSGDTISLSAFRGKKLLIVNVASECGYTPQYADLQKLHEQFNEKLVVIGVPCNQFGGQEPGTNEEIEQFCEKNYGVTFLITEKVDVKGKDQHPLYEWLTKKELNGKDNSEVRWNFHKYLIDESGNLIGDFPSRVNPLDKEITEKI